MELEGDRIVRHTLGEFDRSLFTPFDREALPVPPRRIDDVIDRLIA